MRVLVCGSRDWDDPDAVHVVLDGLLEQDYPGPLTVIEGGAKGADDAAGFWARGAIENEWPVHHQAFLADWKTHGKAAGPIRNQQMLDEGKPDVVWAFKDNFDWGWIHRGPRSCDFPSNSHGTEDMVQKARYADIPCYVVSRA